ncbi:MAG TPA: hypothetical protein VGM64_06600 [Lacunisphaera sp.]|jgi:hypothetical protein
MPAPGPSTNPRQSSDGCRPRFGGRVAWFGGIDCENEKQNVFEKSTAVIVAICRVSLLSPEKKYQKQNTFFARKNPRKPRSKKSAALVVHRANKAHLEKHVANNSAEIPYENRVNAGKK